MVTNVLVTGGTGALGTELVPLLVTAGLHVRVLSRRRAPAVPAGAQAVRGDLTTGDGLDEAVTAIDVIAHLASETSGIPSYAKAQRTDVEGTGRLLDSARRAGVEPHVVYISIVGVDKIPFGYYRGKLATEQVIERSGLPYTILRTTQWHTLAAKFCLQLGSLPLVPSPRACAFHPSTPAKSRHAWPALSEGRRRRLSPEWADQRRSHSQRSRGNTSEPLASAASSSKCRSPARRPRRSPPATTSRPTIATGASRGTTSSPASLEDADLDRRNIRKFAGGPRRPRNLRK